MTFSLRLFGGASLEGEGGALTGAAAQRHRIALLALLATSPSRALTRDKLMALLWPGRDADHARNLLNQAVYVLRKALGDEAILSAGEELRLDTGAVACDVVAFEEALAAGDLERSVGIYSGPFLDGFHLGDAPEFERWADGERERLAGACAKALEELAEAAEGRGDLRGAAEWWKARAAHDPYDSRVALRLMQALEAGGNPAGALQHAAMHERLLREELGMSPAPEVVQLAERLRREPAARAAPGDEEREAAAPIAEVPGTVAEPAADAPSPRPNAATGPPATRRLRPAVRYGTAALLLGIVILGAIWLGSGPPEAPAPSADGPGAGVAVDEIARAVAREVDRRLRGDTAERLPRHRTQSIPAYEFYLRGSDPAVLRSDSAARQGLEYFRRAIALDSSYAAAWAGLARLHLRVGASSDPDTSPRHHLALAEAAALEAVALDDSLAEAHAALGLVRMRGRDLGSAEIHLRRAIDLDPADALTREWMVGLHLWNGRPGEALAEAERALELDPLSPSATAEVARALLANGRCEEALARLEELAALEPPLLRVPSIAAQCYARQGRWSEAVAVLRPQADRGGPYARALLGYVLAQAGQREEALRIRAILLDRWRRLDRGAFHVAAVDAGLGDLNRAFTWLDRAVEDGSLTPTPGRYPQVVLERLRHDPRFGRLSERLGLQKR